jgi:eukaryotic-like serine/threonine-protein kinase
MLSDFGLATRLGTGRVASPQGYLYHIAPEVIRAGITNPATDVYAAGITIYRLLNGDEYLPSSGDESAYTDAITEGRFPDRNRYRLFIPRNLKTVVNRAMNIDPAQRYQSATAFRYALEGIHIGADWVENPTVRGTEWTASLGSCEVTVRLIEDRRGSWRVETVKRATSPAWRRQAGGCDKDFSAGAARRFASRILVDYVTGRRS